MSSGLSQPISRRAVLRGTGALVLSFSLAPRLWSQAAGGSRLPGSLAKNPLLDAWIRIDADGRVTAFTGKAELGQGIRTALLQVVAEELEVPFGQVSLVTADTNRTVDEGYTAGSHSVQDSGTALRNAAAQVREILIAEAARRLKAAPDQLRAEAGAVIGPNSARITYAELVSANLLHAEAQPTSRLKDASFFKVMDKPVQRVDIPAKVTGGAAYVQDMRLPGMLHARVVRPPGYGAKLMQLDASNIEKMTGVVKVVRDGDFLAVVAYREFQAIKAMQALSRAATWQENTTLPKRTHLHEHLLGLPSEDHVILDKHDSAAQPKKTLQATYTRPYISHGSVGPSCAIAHLTEGVMTIWTHSQGVYPDRRAICEMLGMPQDKVHCIHVEGSGCYGHNGADDAAADAALIASSMPDRPIRVQWMREQEHGWEPYGPAMIAKASASLDSAGRIMDWDYGVWSNTHTMRPGPAGSLLAAQHMAKSFPVPEPEPIPQPEGGGDRNAIPLYTLPNARVTHHFLRQMPVRISALRSLGAHMNVFAIESFMDELAQAAGTDPVAFRLAHLDDPRARDVVTAAADEFHWSARSAPAGGHGYGFAFARYKNLAAYCAVAMQVHVDRESGRTRVLRVCAAVDTGQVINPDGVRNQIEGAILQSMSWTMFEGVSFDATRITSIDWSTYPILRFGSVPESLSVRIIERPGTPFLGCGEAAHGPASAALANAVANAISKRVRDMPLNAARVKGVIGV
ncbi:MAG: xanthine dehydrogenase family protein molybdopterin-binding subunit [Proteobacteria bacterium]|nr:xanthine dehydrogenase family protein molybdopterin-binding subunit [Pseudomonadota bacterium]